MTGRTIAHYRILEKLGGVTASPGSRILLLETVWENRIPLQIVGNQAMAIRLTP